MSEDNNNNGNVTQEDPIKNLKGEFNRKLSNQEEQLTKLAQQNEQLINAISQMNQPQPAPQNSGNLEDLMYSDPAAYTEAITKQVEGKIRAEIDQRDAVKDSQTKVLNELASEYPELSQANHPMTLKAVEIYERMTDQEKVSPMAYKIAVQEAALRTGTVPASQRHDEYDGDSFSLSGKGGSGKPRSKKARLSKEAKHIASVLGRKAGIDTNDPKFEEELAKSTQNVGLGTWNTHEYL